MNSLSNCGFPCCLRYQKNLCICCLDSGLPSELGNCADCHGTILKVHGYAKKDSHGVTLKPINKVCGACAYGEDPREYVRKLLRKGKDKGNREKRDEAGEDDAKVVEEDQAGGRDESASDYDPIQDATIEKDDISSIEDDLEDNGLEDEREADIDGEIDPAKFKRAELCVIAKGLGVGVGGNKAQLAARINEERAKLSEMEGNVVEEKSRKDARASKRREKDVLAARRRAILARVRSVRESIAARRRDANARREADLKRVAEAPPRAADAEADPRPAEAYQRLGAAAARQFPAQPLSFSVEVAPVSAKKKVAPVSAEKKRNSLVQWCQHEPEAEVAAGNNGEQHEENVSLILL